MRVASVRAARRKLVKLSKKRKSKFYWYDFTVRGRRYRASTQETKSVRALQVASLKLASVMERTDPLPTKPAVFREFADRFLEWVNESRLEEKTRKFYRNDEAERKLMIGATACSWRPRTRELFLFRKARNKAGLPKELVLYGARHDYGTRVLMRTGNLAAVMRTMGHRDVKTAMHYQHPELEIGRAALDYRPSTSEAAA
jgi:hypothetical protein